MSTTTDWVLERTAHLVAVQEHGVPARKIDMYKALAAARGRTLVLGKAAGDAAAPQAGTGFLAAREARMVRIELQGTQLEQYAKAGRVECCLIDVGGTPVRVYSVYGWTGSMLDAQKRRLTEKMMGEVM